MMLAIINRQRLLEWELGSIKEFRGTFGEYYWTAKDTELSYASFALYRFTLIRQETGIILLRNDALVVSETQQGSEEVAMRLIQRALKVWGSMEGTKTAHQ